MKDDELTPRPSLLLHYMRMNPSAKIGNRTPYTVKNHITIVPESKRGCPPKRRTSVLVVKVIFLLFKNRQQKHHKWEAGRKEQLNTPTAEELEAIKREFEEAGRKRLEEEAAAKRKMLMCYM